MFHRTLTQLRQGSVIDDLDAKLNELILMVKHTGKGGELSLKLKVKPLTEGGTTVQIEDVVSAKIPLLPLEKTVMFTTLEGELVRHDPRQGKLDLKQVGGSAPAELKTVVEEPAQAPLKVVGA